MEFISGLLWGTGLSLGFCVGLVAWMFLKAAVHRVLGTTAELADTRTFTLRTLEALLDRNRLTHETNEWLSRIAAALEQDSGTYRP